MTNNSTGAHSASTGIIEALLIGLFISGLGGVADVFLSMLLLPMGLASARNFILIWATGTLGLALVSALAVVSVHLLRKFGAKFPPLPAIGFFSSLTAGVAVLSTAHHMLIPRWDPMPGWAFVLAGLFVLGVAVVMASVVRHLGSIASRFTGSAFFVACGTLLAFWMLSYHAESLLTMQGLVAVVVQLIAFVGVIALLRRPTSADRWLRVAAAMLPAFMLMGFALVWRLPPQSGVGWRDSEFQAPGREVKKVVLICIDTLRADRLSCMGQMDNKTPWMDKLASDGVLFKHAVSPAAWTRPAVASIMTGVPVDAHGVYDPSRGLPQGMPTLADAFQSKGFMTALIGDNLHLMPATGLNRGFQEYNFFPRVEEDKGAAFGARILERCFRDRFLADATTVDLAALAKDWLKVNRNKDFFLWLHLYTPHVPYGPPLRLLPSFDYDPRVGFIFDPDARDQWKFPKNYTIDPPTIEWVRTLYDAEVRHADEAVGEVIESLQNLDIYDDTLIILVSDHGEELWEHGQHGHAHALHEELLHVPLIFKLPESKHAGTEVKQSVPSMGIYHTLNELCSLEAPTPYPLAASFRPLWSGEASSARPLPIISRRCSRKLAAESRSILLESSKFIVPDKGLPPTFIDLASDPDEKNSRPAEVSAAWSEAQELLLIHDQASAAIRQTSGEAVSVILTEESQERLKNLGYLK